MTEERDALGELGSAIYRLQRLRAAHATLRRSDQVQIVVFGNTVVAPSDLVGVWLEREIEREKGEVRASLKGVHTHTEQSLEGR